MPSIEVNYLGGDRSEVRIRGHRLVVDQPHDDGGGDLGPTPTELFVASLAGCVAFFAERFLGRHGLSARGLGVEVTFDMAPDRPARVGSVQVWITVPHALSPRLREAMHRVIESCTVHNSIRHPPETTFALLEAAAAA